MRLQRMNEDGEWEDVGDVSINGPPVDLPPLSEEKAALIRKGWIDEGEITICGIYEPSWESLWVVPPPPFEWMDVTPLWPVHSPAAILIC